MGYYINQTSDGLYLPSKGKADFILQNVEGAIEINTPKEWREGLVCVVENAGWDAAGYAYSEQEMKVFKKPDGRKTRWLLVPDADILSGFKEEKKEA